MDKYKAAKLKTGDRVVRRTHLAGHQYQKANGVVSETGYGMVRIKWDSGSETLTSTDDQRAPFHNVEKRGCPTCGSED